MYRALVSFSGLVSMAEGDVREISDKDVVKDLLNAGYIEEVKTGEKSSAKRKKTTKK